MIPSFTLAPIPLIEVAELLKRHLRRWPEEASLKSDEGLVIRDESGGESDDSGLASLIDGHT